MRIHHCIYMLVLFTAPLALAKHVTPPNIEPVVHQGVRYVVPNDKGLRAYVEAWDIQTGRKLWAKTVFRHWYVPVPFGPTECMHYEYITSMILQTNLLMLTSEHGRKYTLDIHTRTIRQVKPKQSTKSLQPTPGSGRGSVARFTSPGPAGLSSDR
jgi:hypothetical protein